MKKDDDVRVSHPPTPRVYGPRGIHRTEKSSIGRQLLRAVLVVLIAGFFWGEAARAQHPTAFKNMASYVAYVNKHHKAPFDRDAAVMPPGGAKTLMERQAKARAEAATMVAAQTTYKNVQVNQDRNPWPKAEVGAAIDPSNPNNWVVMTNDFRLNFDHEFYHVSTNAGLNWTDDEMVGGRIPLRSPLSRFKATREYRLTARGTATSRRSRATRSSTLSMVTRISTWRST